MNQPVDNLAKNINLMGRPREIINQCYYNLLAMYFLCWKDKSQALSIGRMLLDQYSAREVNGEHASFGKGTCLLKNKQAPKQIAQVGLFCYYSVRKSSWNRVHKKRLHRITKESWT